MKMPFVPVRLTSPSAKIFAPSAMFSWFVALKVTVPPLWVVSDLFKIMETSIAEIETLRSEGMVSDGRT